MKNRKKALTLLLSATLLLSPFQNGLGSAKPARGAEYGASGSSVTADNRQSEPIGEGNEVISVSLGGHHSAAVTKSGDLYCWGKNGSGQVGNGSKEDQTAPVKVLENVASVSLSEYHSAAVTKSGDLYCWGDNRSGQVGNGSKEDQTAPVKVLENVISVSLGWYHSAAVTKSGDLYCWGNNYDGQVGNGSNGYGEYKATPVKVLENVSSVSLGNDCSAAVTKSGDLYCWGDNSSGYAGNGSNVKQTTPVKVLENVASVSLGKILHSAAVTKSGDLYCWGSNSEGQVGNGSNVNQTTPVKVLENVASVSLGWTHSAAVTKSGDLYCWGMNYDGQVGNGSKEDQTTPIKVLENVASVSLGSYHSAAVTKSGDLYCWGMNHDGQVGNGSKEDQRTPVKVLENVSSVSLEIQYSAAVTKSGDLYCWGYNSEGQAGNGSKEGQTTPIKVLGNMSSATTTESPSATPEPTPGSTHTHDYGVNWKNDATSHWHECDCGEKADKTEHTEDSGTVTKEPTETETGQRTYKCSVCGYVTRTETIAMLPTSHTHVYGTEWKSNGTNHWKECLCGEKKENTIHTEDAGTVTKEPTETEMGLRTYKCSVCGYVTRTEKIAMLPPSHTHSYGTDWKSSAATHWKECSCGEKKDETAHTEDAGTVTKEPTETETGVRTYKCSVCGYVIRTEEIEKHGEGFFEKGDETTSEVETPPEAADIPEDNRIMSITINPAFNMKHKDGNEVELDLSKIKIKAKEIYDEDGLKRAEAALGETLKGNKHYNLLDLTLLYDGKDFSNGYDGLVKVIIPLPKGHRDKTFSCYRLTEKDGKMIKELIPGQQTEDSYIIYLEHFSEYALVATEPEEQHTHVYSTDWKSDATGHWKECACKDRTEESVHMQDAGTVTKEATETETGIKTYKCSVCGYVIKTEVIAKLQKGITNKQSSTTTKFTKAQKYKNGIIINKKISFKLTGNSLAVTWNKLPDVDGYDIFAASCDEAFKGITISVKKNNSSAIIRKINGRKIDGKKTYKVKVKAYRFLSNGKKQYIGTSAVMHVTGSLNKTRTNVKKISLKKKAFALKKGKTAQIRATIIKMNRKKKLLSKTHGAKLSYVSSDKAIATVTATGKIKAKKTGKCTIYVRALNGVSKKIKVTVK